MADEPARTTLQDLVYAGISADIMRGALRPGEKLLVAHLARRFGTSQAPVREALRRLTEEGRAVTVPYVGTVVKEPTWVEIQDIYALRTELEAFAIRLIFSRSPHASFSSINRALRELRRAVKSGNEVDVLDADLAFHRSVLELSGSNVTQQTWESLVRQFRGVRLSLMGEHPDNLETIVPSHERLIRELESGDSDRAQHAFREHLIDAAETFAQRTGNEFEASMFFR